jgi:TRAP-type C4-dicarboxylate transport system substrate-binding protein
LSTAFRKLGAVCAILIGLSATTGQAKELVYGILAPLTHPGVVAGVKPLFDQLEKDTKGGLTWRIVPNGQLLTGQGTLPGLRDGLADGGYLITPYARSSLPTTNFIYDLFQFGTDAAAVAGATAETLLLNCPQCIEEFRKNNVIWLIGVGLSPSRLLCGKEVKSLADVKGKKIKGTGGVEARWIQAMGGVHLNMTMPDAVVAAERGTIDCMIGPIAFIKAYGLWDVVKYVPDAVMGVFRTMGTLVMNRDSWNKLSAEEKKAIIKHSAMTTSMVTIRGYIQYDEDVKGEGAKKGIRFGGGNDIDALKEKHIEKDRDVLIADAKKERGVKDPEGLMKIHLELLKKWDGIVKKTGHDIDKFAQAMWDEVYSKVDLGKI